jgi:hypothetical protein
VCLHIFSPGKRLELDYVAESNTLVRGATEDLIELLVTNHSSEDIDRIHVVYPHALPDFSSRPASDDRTFEDLTATWLDPIDRRNRFYQSIGKLQVENPFGDEYLVSLSIRDLQSPAVTNPYKGSIRGDIELTRYHPANGLPLNDDEWAVLSSLDLAIITIHFRSSIRPNEARWLRILGRGGRLPQNSHPFLEYWYRKLCGLLVDTFKIEGPFDVKDYVIAHMRAADQYRPNALSDRMKVTLVSVVQKVLNQGMEAAGTELGAAAAVLSSFPARGSSQPRS